MKYYITNNGQQSGPFELHELLLNGLNAQSYVWNETMPNWQTAMQVPEVAALLQQPQTPPPAYGQPYQQQAYGQPQQPYQQSAYGQPQPGYQQPYQQQPRSMDFGEAIKVCFNKFADFNGRARRSEFWWFQLLCYLVSSFTCGFAGIVFLIPVLSSGARRLHDTGRSGWWQLLQFIPIVGIIILIIWWVEDSNPNQNEYGPNPKY
ncbi:MAG: DUF805 domain-containing protein [Muribaculaceae bacterium]|nr:DUF805 domain-containing protein [Muribaculaceae bacterium]